MTKEEKEELIRHLKYNLEIGADYLITDKDAIEIIKALEQTRWIPVSEKLPASDEDVLVTNGRGMYVGWIDHNDKIWRVDSESEYFMYDIIAWMPLPEPYKVENKMSSMTCKEMNEWAKAFMDGFIEGMEGEE